MLKLSCPVSSVLTNQQTRTDPEGRTARLRIRQLWESCWTWWTSEGSRVVSTARILLGIISITVNSEWECVNGNEKGINYNSLRDAMGNCWELKPLMDPFRDWIKSINLCLLFALPLLPPASASLFFCLDELIIFRACFNICIIRYWAKFQ